MQEKILAKLRGLSPAEQEEVLRFAESLEHPNGPAAPLQSLEGLWADLNIHISDVDIAEARREMWGSFPREVS